jgi:hypothetical protein
MHRSSDRHSEEEFFSVTTMPEFTFAMGSGWRLPYRVSLESKKRGNIRVCDQDDIAAGTTGSTVWSTFWQSLASQE